MAEDDAGVRVRSSPPSAPPEESQDLAGVQEGDILADKYRIDKVLGVGGMGVVVAAHHIQLDERVAIKFLLPGALSSGEIVARFAREARAAVKIKSEHVARIIDVGTLNTGAPYMVMEYLEGGDLDAWVRRRGPLAVEQAVEFILQACEAIAEAHSLGIVHRDLKPANLFCIRRPDGTLAVKVLDFGISKVAGGLSASGQNMSMTKTSSMMGSPLYMSPEQMQSSRTVDCRTDIWALGVVLYELLTGHAPFVADSIPELCMKVLIEPPPPLQERRPDVPPGFEEVILGCLQKDRNNRYATVAEFAAALAPFAPARALGSIERIGRVVHGAASQTNEANASALAEAGKPKVEGRTTAPWESMSTQAPAPRSKAIWVVGLSVLAVGAVVGAMTLRGRAASSTAQAPAADASAFQSPVGSVQLSAVVVAEDAAASAPTAVASSAPDPAASTSTEKPEVQTGSAKKGKGVPSSSSKAAAGSTPASTGASTAAAPARTTAPTSNVFDDRR